MKVPLSPLGIPGHGRGLPSGRQCAVVECIDVGNVEDHAATPRPALLPGLGNQVEMACSNEEAGERRCLAAMPDVEAERTVEPDGAPHVMRAECDCADPFDHDGAPGWAWAAYSNTAGFPERRL